MKSLHDDMRLLPLAILLILLLAVPCGCRREPDARLVAAEVLMDERPDSALLILDSVDAGALRGESDRALYAMLLTMARDKCYLDPTDDSLITVAADYYREHDDPKRAAISSYYQGRVYYLRDSLPAALVSYLRAKDLAERHDDPFWAGMACRGISKIYQDIDNYGTQLTYARMQKDYTVNSGRQPFQDYAWVDYACALHNAEKVDSALAVLDYLLGTYTTGSLSFVLPASIYSTTVDLYNDWYTWSGFVTRDQPVLEIPDLEGTYTIKCNADDGKTYTGTLEF